MMSLNVLLMAATISANNFLCPAMPEPAPLNSARFDPPTGGRTMMIGTAPSFLPTRFVIRLSQPRANLPAIMTVLRLTRGYDCNLHRLDRRWEVRIPARETASFFDKLERWQASLSAEKEITLDGTTIDYRQFDGARRAFAISSNGPSMTRLGALTLDLVRRHLRAAEVPAESDWRWQPPAKRR